MKISVIGCGAYGISLALMLAKKKENNIQIWSHAKTNLKEIIDGDVPKNLSITNSYEEALNETSLILLVTAVSYIQEVCNNIKKYYRNTPICIASKGIENKTLQFSSEIVKNTLNTRNIAVISGPTFAEDLKNNEPAALSIAGLNNNVINLVKDNLANDTLKLRKSSDIIGIQICGSIKNIIAIASGIIKGIGYSESTNAFLINESLHDMKNIIHALGGKKKTILSFAGIGDLLLTCSSAKSRNYSFGYTIGSTKDKKQIEDYLNNNTVEGYYTLRSIYNLLKNKGIEIPLITLIYDIVYNYKDPNLLIDFLIKKD